MGRHQSSHSVSKDLRDVFGSSIYSKLFTEQRMMTSARLIINEALFDNTREDKFFVYENVPRAGIVKSRWDWLPKSLFN